MANLLLDEQPLILLPKLAKAIGLNEAIVLQQIHFLLGMKIGGRAINGHKWIWNTFEQWQADHFPFWCIRTLKTIIKGLERKGLLISCQPDGVKSRKKYYRINLAALAAATSDSANVARWDGAASARSKTENTTETTESKGTEGSGVRAETPVEVGIPATWRPDTRTKAEKLASARPYAGMPSQQEFDAFIDDEDLVNVANGRSDLYLELCHWKWRTWKERGQKWVPIKDWKAFVRGLDQRIGAMARN